MMIFGELPPEMRAQIEAQMDQANMINEAVRNSVKALIAEANPEQLLAMRFMMTMVQQNKRYAHFLEGMIVQTLEIKYDVCGNCGENHAARDLLTPPPIDTSDPYADIDAEDRATMEAYAVWPAPHGAVKCRNCERLYGGLNDRMIFPPGVEGCPQCKGGPA